MSWSSPLFKCFCFILFVILIGSIIVGSIGASSYVKTRHDQSIYKSTACLVTKLTSIKYKCQRRRCNGIGTLRKCKTIYYTCYTGTYTVIYYVSNGKQIQSTIQFDGFPSKLINGTYQCYYDSTNEKSVRWTWPNSDKYLIMLCVGWSIFLLFIIGLIVGITWKNFRLKNKNNSVNQFNNHSFNGDIHTF